MIEYFLFAPFKLTGGKPVRFLGGNNLLFLSLHRVRKETSDTNTCNAFLDISTAKLEALLIHLKTLNVSFINGDNFPNQNSEKRLQVHITLDDGYKDNLYHALPVFEKYNVPFTLFLTTGIPDKEAVLWWYHIERILQKGGHLKIPAFNIDINARRMSKEKQLEVFEFLRKFFLENYSAFKNIIDEALINSGSDNKVLLDELGLTWNEVRKIAASQLCTIGNHTRHHFCMSKLSPEAILEEVNYAQQRIKAETGKLPKSLAFPFGAKDDIADMSRVEGFDLQYVFSTESGIIRNFEKVNKYNIPRHFLNNSTTPFSLNMMINGMRHRVNKLLY